jgi:adenine deaminase
LGAIAPAWLADILLLDDLHQVHVRHVITSGRLRVKDCVLEPVDEPVPPPDGEFRCACSAGLDVESFMPQVSGGSTCQVNAINLANLINTQLETLELPCENGRVRFPLPEGVSLAAVVGRHGQGNPPSLAFVTGYPLGAGAVASTVSHDSHNLAIIGKTPEDLCAAAEALARTGGGLAAVRDGQVFAEIQLPIAGLMSPLPLPEVAQELTQFEQRMPKLGLMPVFPGTCWQWLCLVIPVVRLTDLGMADTTTQQFIPMQA